jgi:NAD(P)-dependent dehydrogenase (short-subunit alcohol dehydrogenase family)
MAKTWLITGCSSGFGRILAEQALIRGDNVIATARNVEGLAELAKRFPDNARVTALDVTKDGDAAAAVALAESAFGGLDILVNNAGYGFVGAIEEGAPDEYRPMYETNVFGLIETTRAALPALRRTGGGRIVNFSSIGGLDGRAGFGFYAGTKFAVEGISEALAREVAPFGIRVVIVEPGAFRTEFLGRSINAAKVALPAYAATSGRTRSFSEGNNGNQMGDPHKGIAVLLKAIDAEDSPLHLVLGRDAYDRAREKFANIERDMATWEKDAVATAFSQE